ncbi:MAG TPA: bifunctional riboflavin kinase/FAD synthetase [Bacteroidales bacterium]|nr:bifunctional riboflavin kinase/FAD synthetase [Bacteroidales bacterium]
MIVHQGYASSGLFNPVVTLGVFDGVHLGHRLLIERVKSAARKFHGESVIITFNPHPRQVVGNDNGSFFLLTTITEKLALLEANGVDHVIILEFSRELAATSACDFIRDMLIGKTAAKHLIMGHDHRFGREGEGDIETIRSCPDLKDIEIEQVDAFLFNGRPVSSSLIREALLRGNIDEANSMLGYKYELSGKVVEGKKIGRSFGFPTANISSCSEFKLIPANGVYAVEVIINHAEKYKGMLSIGTNPTVNSDMSKRSIEVNIFEFDRNIYGSEITVRFHSRMRDERRFATTEELVRQIELDKLNAMNLLT